MKTIPLVDLSRQHQPLEQEINKALARITNQSNFILGKEVEKFEDAFAGLCQCQHGIGVASGTDALFLALKAIVIGRDDIVIIPANTFIATALAVTFTGAKPFLADIDEGTFNLNAENLEAALWNLSQNNSKCKAIIPVHLYGQPCPMDEIMAVAEKYQIPVIEDACQAHGALYNSTNLVSNRVGSIGAAGCFSFFPGKNLGAFGDGGMVVTNDSEIAEQLRLLRNYGSTKKYIHQQKGYNSRLDTIQAAILTTKLIRLEEWNEQRRQLAARYTEMIGNSPVLSENIGVPIKPRYADHVYHLFVIRLQERDRMLEHLHANRIMGGIHYPIPIHLQEAYRDLNLARGSFPVAEKLADEILSLPIFPGMTDDEVLQVVECLESFY